MTDLTGVSIFVKVVEKGGFTSAAAALGVSQPVVSRAVTALERRLGVRLLQRTTRRINLTEAGAEFYRRAVAGLAEIEDATLEVTRYQKEPRGTIRVSAPVAFSQLHLAPHLTRFLQQYPGVRLNLQVDDRHVKLVEEGYDIAIRIGVLQDSQLVAKRLAGVPVVTCAAPSYLARKGEPLHPQDLVRHDCLVYTVSSHPTTWRFRDREGAAEIAVPVQGPLHTNNGMIEKQAALGGAGIAVLPLFYVADELRAGSLQLVLDGFRPSELGIYAVYPERRGLAPKVRAFVDFVAQTLRAPLSWGHWSSEAEPRGARPR